MARSDRSNGECLNEVEKSDDAILIAAQLRIYNSVPSIVAMDPTRKRSGVHTGVPGSFRGRIYPEADFFLDIRNHEVPSA